MFQIFYLFFVALQDIVIVLKTIPGELSRGQQIALDIFFLVVFLAEIILTMSLGFVQYWQKSWNCLATSIWITEVVCLSVGSGNSFVILPHKIEMGNVASTIRICKILVPFKSRKRAHYLAGVRSIVATISESVSDAARIAILVIMLSFFWASIGKIVFAEIIPLDFATLMDGKNPCRILT